MNTRYNKILIFALAAFVSLFTFFQFSNYKTEEIIKQERIRSSSSPKAGIEMKKGRFEHYFKMVRDPATNQIPDEIRTRELEFAKKLNDQNNSLGKYSSSGLTWAEAGPNNVGGRTRALAVDVTNPNVIIAGGASGGIWKSNDNGNSWIMKSSTSTILSVTSIAQDPRPGFTSTWYYSTGEFLGSGNDLGFTARFSGDGVYKSNDNGETWQVLPSTLSTNTTQWDSQFDYVLNVKVHPVTGTVYLATNGDGIYKSADGGATFNSVLGGPGEHMYSDVSIGSNGTILAVLSKPFQGITSTNPPGLYRSTNDGVSWTNISPAGYTNTSMRSVVTIAPSNPNVGYLLNYTGASSNNREVVKFFKINISGGTSEDRSNNLPDFSSLGGVAQNNGFLTTQGGYDMVVAVKPDNENFVMIAGTCMFRSSDGFATQPTDHKIAWIGGYHPVYFGYPNFHPDVHSYSFDPTDPKKMWWGHDGGLSYTTDITNTAYAEYFPWINKNNGYNVTQFYHISLKENSTDSRIMGGTQDNGSPYFTYSAGSPSNMVSDVSSGDGSYSYFAQNFAYTSSQNGFVCRLRYDGSNNPQPPFSGFPFAIINPTGATGQSFINPFAIDPNNEEVMYYPAGNALWRNNQLSSIPDGVNGTSVGWTNLTNLAAPQGYFITAVTVSRNPAHVLYYSATNFQTAPKIYKLTNSATATSGVTEIPIPAAPNGAYVHGIAVNPDDANEIIVVMSNYNIIGLYHSTNGGQLYTAIEGNLEGTQQNPGPSLRSASILPGSNKNYFVATSTGLYSTTQINGNNTTWVLEGASQIGNVIVDHVVSRKTDGRVVAGTHGRGAFVGSAGGGGVAILNVNVSSLHYEVLPNGTRTKEIIISNPGGANLDFNITATFNGDSPNKGISPIIASNLSVTNNLNGINLKKVPALNNSTEVILEPDAGEQELILDDGDAFPDAFFGVGLNGYNFFWANRFQLTQDFDLEKVRWYMKTESAGNNQVEIEVQSSTGSTIFNTTQNMSLSSSGKWYEYELPQSISFQNGNSFYLIIISRTSSITFPAAYDDDGQVTGNSYWAYYEVSSGYFSGWVVAAGNTAWLVRAVGNSGGGENQPPVAVAQVSPNPANVNETVIFNGQSSSDPDGTIVQYAWVFGDGNTSNQMNATHAYSQAGTYNYSLTVTDNLGATGQTNGQITINGGPSRWTIIPSNGNVSSGGQQSVLITFDAQNLPEGNYTGQINVTSNGGNMNIPVTIWVSNSADAEDDLGKVISYSLEQNFPNPFNPSTTIRWSIADAGNVQLKIFNLNGEEITTLVNEYRNAGSYETIFNAALLNRKALASGIYFYTLRTDNFSESKKFVLLK